MPVGLGAPEIMIILLVLIVFFGTSRLPKIARSLGEGIREFRNSGKQFTRAFDEDERPRKKS